MLRHAWIARAVALLVACAACVGLAAGRAGAQTTTATVQGVVRDPSGAVLPGATVTLQDVNTGFARTTTSDRAGAYVLAFVPPGAYELTVDLAGFKTLKRGRLQFDVGQESTIDATLEIASVAETVTVREQAPVVETTKSTVDQVIRREQIDNLPLTGRQASSLALLAPGVVQRGTDTAEPVTAGGQPRGSGETLVDGVSTEMMATNSIRSNAPPDAIEEFQVLTNQYQAEFGNATGVHRYQLKDRRGSTFLEGIRSFTLSGDTKKLLYQTDGNRWGIVPAVGDRPVRVGDGSLDTSKLEMWADPRTEWAQIFRETWRIEREFFYDAAMHGADWEKVYAKYSTLLPHVQHRADLGYLIATVGGELSVGHSYLTGAGDQPEQDAVQVGLLGADFTIDRGRYRIKTIYTGENWNPDLQAPLSAPGVQVAEGDYLLEVNGRPLAPPSNLYQLFEGTAGRQTLIRVNSTPSLEGSRLVTVVPVASEEALRTRAWIERNRRLVEKLSNGRLAYVWLPNTATPGYAAFNRYYYAQQHKDGAIIDERYNQGGMVADYIVNELDRKQMGYFARRDGKPSPSPAAGIYGPKVMVINESAGSGGDALPYYFKQRKVGPLVGTRTWGGLVGTLAIPQTIDGGGITAPSLAFYDMTGRWAVENEGVAPDIEVENTPAAVIGGHDPQLERAVQEAMKLLEQNPSRRVPRPAPIDRVSGKQK
jgi:hypothetical protein